MKKTEEARLDNVYLKAMGVFERMTRRLRQDMSLAEMQNHPDYVAAYKAKQDALEALRNAWGMEILMAKVKVHLNLRPDTKELLRELARELGLSATHGPTVSGAVDWLGKKIKELGPEEFARRVRGE